MQLLIFLKMLLTNKNENAILQVQSESDCKIIVNIKRKPARIHAKGGSNMTTIYDELNDLDDSDVAITPTAYEVLNCGR